MANVRIGIPHCETDPNIMSSLFSHYITIIYPFIQWVKSRPYHKPTYHVKSLVVLDFDSFLQAVKENLQLREELQQEEPSKSDLSEKGIPRLRYAIF